MKKLKSKTFLKVKKSPSFDCLWHLLSYKDQDQTNQVSLEFNTTVT